MATATARTAANNFTVGSLQQENYYRKSSGESRKKPLRVHSNIQRATVKIDISDKNARKMDSNDKLVTPRNLAEREITPRSGQRRFTNSPSMGEIRGGRKSLDINQENEPSEKNRTLKKTISRESSKKKSYTKTEISVVSPRNSVTRAMKPLAIEEKIKKRKHYFEDSTDMDSVRKTDSELESPRTERSIEPALKIGLVGWNQGKHVVVALHPNQSIARKSRAVEMEVSLVWDPKISDLSDVDPFVKFTSDFPSLLNPNIDIIGFYYEDPDTKIELMLEALKNGKNVIVEYPLVFNLEQARKINNEIENLTGNLRVVQITQVIPSFIHQQREYAKGSIGELEMVEVHYLGWNVNECKIDYQYRPIKALSSVVTMIRCFINRIESVHAFSKPSQQSRSQNPVVNDIYIVNIVSKTGEIAKATVNCCLSIPEKVLRCKLYGSKGTSEASYPDMLYTQLNSNQDKPIIHEFLTAENKEFYFNQKEKNPTNIPYGCYSNYFNHFARAIVSQQNDKIKFNIIQALQTAIIVEAILRSVIEKRSIKIKEIRNEVFSH